MFGMELLQFSVCFEHCWVWSWNIEMYSGKWKYLYMCEISSCRYSGEMREIGAYLDEVANLLWGNVSNILPYSTKFYFKFCLI
jgi:hypothetical protein